MKNIFKLNNETEKVYEYCDLLQKYKFIGYFCTFKINKNMGFHDKINKIIMHGVDF